MTFLKTNYILYYCSAVRSPQSAVAYFFNSYYFKFNYFNDLKKNIAKYTSLSYDKLVYSTLPASQPKGEPKGEGGAIKGNK